MSAAVSVFSTARRRSAMQSPDMQSYFWIAIGSALGGMARQYCGVLALRLLPTNLPWGTIIINIVGSFVIGAFATLTESTGRFPMSLVARQFVMVGICGGYTTFSSFSLQTLMLARDGQLVMAGLNIALSVVLCLIAVAAGHALATAVS
jgi:CrcB protein